MKKKKVAWNKGLTSSQDIRVKNISEKLKNRIPWNKGLTKQDNEIVRIASEKRKGQKAWNKNIKHSEETRLKISNSLKGCIPWNINKKHSEETKLKISNSLKGCIPWNKGLTKENNLSLQNVSNKLKNREFSEEHRKKISISNKGKLPYNTGKKRPKELVDKITLAVKKTKEQRNYTGNMHHTDKTKKHLSEVKKESWKNPTIKMLDGIKKSNYYPEGRSYQEKILFNKVKDIYKDISNIISNKRIDRKIVDILIDKFNLIIEYDGLHFHKDLNRDIERDKNLVNLGYKVIHYRGYNPDEFEIINDVNYMLENTTKGLYKEKGNIILNIN